MNDLCKFIFQRRAQGIGSFVFLGRNFCDAYFQVDQLFDAQLVAKADHASLGNLGALCNVRQGHVGDALFFAQNVRRHFFVRIGILRVVGLDDVKDVVHLLPPCKSMFRYDESARGIALRSWERWNRTDGQPQKKGGRYSWSSEVS